MNRFREAFPIFSVADVDRAVELYCSTLGFERAYSFDDADQPSGERMCTFRDADGHVIHVGRRR